MIIEYDADNHPEISTYYGVECDAEAKGSCEFIAVIANPEDYAANDK